ncbi:hypothetical protein MPRM_42600 [Mycobacterium parmense]|uniref:Uncharacterized protein n=1 Tax=Mycobacterium parmense TaxID=185642 RepID=A0A7I7YZ78_9MYCO|nr:hypothetical protein MPRM_42600 [Mycobacterium parmense]
MLPADDLVRYEPVGGCSQNLPRAQGVRLSGVVAAAVWAIGVVVGLVALTAGHPGVALAALVVGVAAPCVGVAWLLREEAATQPGPRCAH